MIPPTQRNDQSTSTLRGLFHKTSIDPLQSTVTIDPTTSLSPILPTWYPAAEECAVVVVDPSKLREYRGRYLPLCPTLFACLINLDSEAILLVSDESYNSTSPSQSIRNCFMLPIFSSKPSIPRFFEVLSSTQSKYGHKTQRIIIISPISN